MHTHFSTVPPTLAPALVPPLVLDKISKQFRSGAHALQVLDEADLTIHSGETVALVGPSGSGKSTLLQIAGLLDVPESGQLYFGGKSAEQLSEGARTLLRQEHLGFVYQFHHLLPEFTALENVMMPLYIAGTSRAKAQARAAEELEKMGLAARIHHRPAALSGGEQQRVAIARALVHRPTILLADEPTGNLDPETAALVGELLIHEAKSRQLALLIVTHNPLFARKMHRVVTLAHGKIIPFVTSDS